MNGHTFPLHHTSLDKITAITVEKGRFEFAIFLRILARGELAKIFEKLEDKGVFCSQLFGDQICTKIGHFNPDSCPKMIKISAP